jgi:hypothetical protein
VGGLIQINQIAAPAKAFGGARAAQAPASQRGSAFTFRKAAMQWAPTSRKTA